MKKIIGHYDYTVILTYMGVVFSLLGMISSSKQKFIAALLYMGAALVCDTFDGRVARAKKNRTDLEKEFGVQIDSLCDVISFGVGPCVFFYFLGLRTLLDLAVMSFYCLCSVIRLAYFNVLAQHKQEGEEAVFHGLPVVCLTVMVPFAFLMRVLCPVEVGQWIARGLIFAFGWLYILDFKVKKGNNVVLGILCLIYLVPMVLLPFLV